ncbi:hypothetical protein [Paenibacillus tyrfis]|uniref:hypothetical protein n=1 Tax=Paenibacillus tyrfis TaxID=1501230 RepID=UPI000B589F52|nr:hypothetical protein [Paenibacillus tyrfis]
MWIESHQGLKDHPKTKRLARKLDIEVVAVVGYLHFLWWWAMDYAPDGNLKNYDAMDIADALGWGGDERHLVDSLLSAGFLDFDEESGAFHIHDWHDYAGRLLEKRASDAQRKREARKKVDVHRPSDGHPSDGAGNRNLNRTYTEPKDKTSSSNTPARVGDGDQAPSDSQTPIDPMIGEPELSAASAYMPILESAYREIFGGLLMPPLISNFIVTQFKRGMTVETVKELLWEAGESAQGGKPPSLRLLEPIAERWYKEGIVSREDNQSRLARGQPAGGGGREPTRKANHSGKPKLEVASAKQPIKKFTRDEYREFYNQARILDGMQPMTDEEFEEVWIDYQARGDRTK